MVRHVALAVAAAESILDRPVETVLDVGCGEGRWQPVLQALRPGAKYVGLDPSEYTVSRFGAARNILRGSFGDLELHAFEDPFDLVVCADVLHYVGDEEILAGIDTLADLVGGSAVVEVFTDADPVLGDRAGFRLRPPEWYRRVFRAAGLVAIGLQMYVHEETAELLEALDRPS